MHPRNVWWQGGRADTQSLAESRTERGGGKGCVRKERGQCEMRTCTMRGRSGKKGQERDEEGIGVGNGGEGRVDVRIKTDIMRYHIATTDS